MPTTHAETPRRCPECDGLGFHKARRTTYAVKCQCCDGRGEVTRADLQAWDRLLDAQNLAARDERRKVTAVIPHQPGAHPFSGLAGEY